MTPAPVVWLASYPRSGNTFLRTIIYHCFGIRSASIYANDLGEFGVGDMVGHIEHRPDGSIEFGAEPVRLLKTHQPPTDDRPAIYVVRDGVAASTSLYEFYKRKMPLNAIVEGRNMFGTWAGHLGRWRPAERPATLFVRYEDMVRDTRSIVDAVARFLDIKPKSYDVPSREQMSRSDGRWIRSLDAPRAALEGELLERFWEINGEAMQDYGYSRIAKDSATARLL